MEEKLDISGLVAIVSTNIGTYNDGWQNQVNAE